jgi:release factor glutamine methyltransferase
VKLRELELELKVELDAAGFADPGFESRQILINLLNISSGELLRREHQSVDEELRKKARHWASERIRGVPLAYLAGKKGFYKYEFLVEPGVLVPRPETEHVIEVALTRVREQNLQINNLVDLGCGAGVLALSLAQEFCGARTVAVDASAQAIALTERNAEKLGVRVSAKVSRVEDFVPDAQFELVVANPPYIARGDANVQASVHAFEPHAALYADDEGLAAIRAWSQWAYRNMREGGLIVMEIGTGQQASARAIMSGLGFQAIQVTKDLAGHDRVVSAIRGNHG